MNKENQPVFMIGVAAKLCGVHPQTLRQYERLGLISPERVGAKNRLYSERDIRRVQRIQRLTQQMGANLAGVEIILKLLDELEEMRHEMERQFEEYRQDAERRIQHLMQSSKVPIRRDEQLLPVPNFQVKSKLDL
jgi:MerR family transcriptional regulator/heat shock protein HspR